VHQLTPERQFGALLATDASRPFVTYYDEATGERSELSAKSLANWVAKTHHLLTDELGLGVGDTALVALPPHWISVPVLLGCLTAGLALTAEGDADVAFVAPDTVAVAVDIPDVYAIAPGSAAVGFRGADPAGTTDYVTAVRPQADAWAGVQLVAGPDDPCFPGVTRGEAVERAAGLEPGARLLSTRDWHSPDDWLATVLRPLAAGGSLVLVRNSPDESVLERRLTQERATVRD
jgi:uncharacterized protein (TIGR03089 family)